MKEIKMTYKEIYNHRRQLENYRYVIKKNDSRSIWTLELTKKGKIKFVPVFKLSNKQKMKSKSKRIFNKLKMMYRRITKCKKK